MYSKRKHTHTHSREEIGEKGSRRLCVQSAPFPQFEWTGDGNEMINSPNGRQLSPHGRRFLLPLSRLYPTTITTRLVSTQGTFNEEQRGRPSAQVPKVVSEKYHRERRESGREYQRVEKKKKNWKEAKGPGRRDIEDADYISRFNFTHEPRRQVKRKGS